MNSLKKVFYFVFVFLFVQGSVILHAQSDYPVGEKFGAVIKDQRVAEQMLSSIRKDTEVQFENGIVANIIEDEDLSPTNENIKKFEYKGDPSDFTSISSEGLEYFTNFVNIEFNNVVLDRFPTEFLNSEKINRFHIDGNQNKETPAISIPEDLLKYEGMKILTTQFVSLSEFPEFLHLMPSLEQLTLNKANYYLKSDDFKIPDNIVNSDSLEEITLTYNHLKKVPNDLYKMSNLKKINLYSNALEELSPENYHFIKSLQDGRLNNQRHIKVLDKPLPLLPDYSNVRIELPQILSMLLTEDPENNPMSYNLEIYDKDNQIKHIVKVNDAITFEDNNKIAEIPKYYLDPGIQYALSITVDSGLLEGSSYKIMFTSSDFYIINYDSNGGSGTMEPQEIYYMLDNMLKKNEFIKEGHKFVGWSLNKDGDTLFELNDPEFNLIPKDYVTLYAIWEEDETHEPKPENPGIDEPIVDEPGESENPGIDEPIVDEPGESENPGIDEPIVDEPGESEVPGVDEPIVDEPGESEVPGVDEPITDAPGESEAPSIDEPVIVTPSHPENSNTNQSVEVITNKPIDVAQNPEVQNNEKEVLNVPNTGISASYAPYILVILLGLLSVVSRSYFKIRNLNKDR